MIKEMQVMWSTSTLKQYATVDPVTATADQLDAALVKVTNNGRKAEIGAAIIAYFMERRGFTFEEAAKLTGTPGTSLKKSAARATVLVELPEGDALVVWSHLTALDVADARALGESLALHPADERVAAFTSWAASQVVEARCAKWEPEAKDNAVGYIAGRGLVIRPRMRDALLAYAEHYGLTLPPVKRTPQLEEGDTTPTAARVATAASLFESDREQGSEGAEFEITDAEAADLVRAVQVAIRTLRRANRADDLDAVAEFIAESLAMIEV